MAFCIIEETADKIKQAIISGRFNPTKFEKMTSIEARKELADIIGNEEQAREINLLFEKKLLLKNQEQAMVNFASEVLGLNNRQREETKAKIKATYAKKKEMIEAPADRFLSEIVADIYSKKYNTVVDLETAETIIEMSKALKESENKLNEVLTETKDYKNEKDQVSLGIDYGAKKRAYEKFIEVMKMEAKQVKYGALSKDSTITTNAKVAIRNVRRFGIKGVFNFVAENSRTLKATFDNSFVGRQARKAMRPGTARDWWRMFIKSFRIIGDILTADFRDGNWKTLATKQGLKNFFLNTTTLAKTEALRDAAIAEIYSRPDYLKGRYENKEGKLDIGVREEEQPTSLPLKIPIIGKFLAAAEASYGISAMTLRADLASNFYQLAESKSTRLSRTFEQTPILGKLFAKEVIDLNEDKQVGDINKVVNEMTGRGKIKHLSEEGQATVNKIFFSIKFAKSQVDTLLSWAYTGRSSFARKQAAKNLLWLIATTAIVQGMFGLFSEDDERTEEDPTSSDFGKVKFGNTRFDLTGGVGSYITLISRIITNEMKSSTTGVKKELGVDYGSPNTLDVFWSFIENKTSPIATVIKSIVKREDFEGRKPTGETILTDLTIPIVFETGKEAYDTEGAAMMIISLIADGLGISANTYSYSGRWESSTAKWTDKFRKEKGETKLKKAGELYDKKVNDELQVLKKDKDFVKMNDEDKLKEIDKMKREVKKDVFKEYDFKE